MPLQTRNAFQAFPATLLVHPPCILDRCLTRTLRSSASTCVTGWLDGGQSTSLTSHVPPADLSMISLLTISTGEPRSATKSGRGPHHDVKPSWLNARCCAHPATRRRPLVRIFQSKDSALRLRPTSLTERGAGTDVAADAVCVA